MEPVLSCHKPDWVQKLKPEDEIPLDMTSLVRNGLEPLQAILPMVEEMRPCQCLHLVFGHEPKILYEVLEEKGFEHYTESAKDIWDVYFRRKNCPCPGQS